jgi:hypothetical protein
MGSAVSSDSDTEFCAIGCPPDKKCPVADDAHGCVIGSTRLHNPGQPRCCEVDSADNYLKTVRDILAHGNALPNAQQRTAGFRRALGAMIQKLTIDPGPSMFSNGTLFIDNSINGTPSANFSPSQVDDLLRLLAKMSRRTNIVEVTTDDILRLPRELREDKFDFMVNNASVDTDNILSVANKLSVFFDNAEGFRVVSLITKALAERDPFVISRVFVGVTTLNSPINKRHVQYIRGSMNKTRFKGNMRVHGNNIFHNDVQLGTINIAEGKTIVTTTDTLTISIQ